MPSYQQAIRVASKRMEEKGISSQTAMLYMSELAQMESYNLYMEYQNEVPEELLKRYEEGVERILNHEPMEYVLGYSWFYGYKFIVNSDVLIPRPETEELVANILADIDEYFADEKEIQCADIGTGSGDIAIALAAEEKKVHMTATDISESAIKVAQRNAEENGVKIDFLVGNMAEPLIEKGLKLDILVCNPPYIPVDEQLEESVRDYEPHVALFGGSDGLQYYREVFKAAPLLLKEKSMMAFEIGYNQKEALLKDVEAFFKGKAKGEVLKDINGKNRMLFVYFNCK